ncbi:hypothetical protein ABPG72_019816 [Tetrahymena utriculariae]
MSQKRGSYKKKESQTNQKQQDEQTLNPAKSTLPDTLNPESSEMSMKATQAGSHLKQNPENSEKKIDGRKRGLKSTHKKAEKTLEEQQIVPAINSSQDNCQKQLQEPQTVTNTQPRPEAKEVHSSINLTSSQRSNSNESNNNLKQKYLQYTCSPKIENKPYQQENKPELPTAIDIGRKIWSMCKFDSSLNGCRFSSQDCRFIHLDMIDQAVLSDSKKLAKLAIIHWDHAKLNSKYQPTDKDLLNAWANSDSNEKNPIFVKYKTMIEEKDPEFAQITQELKAEEMELEELKNALYIKKQRYMTELSSRLRQKILSKSRQKAFDKLLQDSAQRKATAEASLSQEGSLEYFPTVQQRYTTGYQIPQYREQLQISEIPNNSSQQQQQLLQKPSLQLQQQDQLLQQTYPQSQQQSQYPSYYSYQTISKRYLPSSQQAYY